MASMVDRRIQALAHANCRFGAFAFLLVNLLAVHALGQSSSPASDLAGASGIAQLDVGTVSGNVYHNAELGFRYEFPHGWIVNETTAQKRTLEAGHQFVWADDSPTKRDKKAARQCTKDLLFVTQYPEEMGSNGFNPLAFLIAADPKCAPGVSFPSTVKDHEAIQHIASHLGIYFKTLPIISNGPTRIRAFDDNGGVALEISQSFKFFVYEPGSSTVRNAGSSVVVMQARDYWVMWMFMGDSDTQLDLLRASKIFFDTPPGSAK